MSQLQYRVVLFDPAVPRPERPVQAFFNHLQGDMGAEGWAKTVLLGASPRSEVWVYRMEEVLEGGWQRKTFVTSQQPIEKSGNSDTMKITPFDTLPKSQAEVLKG